EVLEDALIDYEGTLFVISHERYFLNGVTNKILELTEEGISEYLGNYDYYLEKKNETIVEEEGEFKTKTQIKLERKKEKEKQQLYRRKKKEIANLEKLIEQKEINIDKLDQLLCNPEIYDEPNQAIELSKEREELQLKLDYLYDEWIILTEE